MLEQSRENLTKIILTKTESQSNWTIKSDWFRNQYNSNRIPNACSNNNACSRIKNKQLSPKSEKQETNPGALRLVVSRGGWLVPCAAEGVKAEMLVHGESDITMVNSSFYDSIPAPTSPRRFNQHVPYTVLQDLQ